MTTLPQRALHIKKKSTERGNYTVTTSLPGTCPRTGTEPSKVLMLVLRSQLWLKSTQFLHCHQYNQRIPKRPRETEYTVGETSGSGGGEYQCDAVKSGISAEVSNEMS